MASGTGRTPFSVTVHPFTSPTANSCTYERGPSSAQNALVFISGLTGGPHTLDLNHLSSALAQSPALDYSLWEFRMRSSYSGFGYSSLANDVEDIAALVQYLRGIGKKKIVLMGASTGCADCLEYTNRDKYQTPLVDGYILQSPISDREAASMFIPVEYLNKAIEVAKDMIEKGQENEAMPKEFIPPIFNTPVTAYRWHSLAAKSGDDDYFSSDLPDSALAASFGRVDKPLLIVSAGEDEMVPPTVDKEALLGRWTSSCKPGIASELSGLVPGANHSVTKPDAQGVVAERVVAFLGSL